MKEQIIKCNDLPEGISWIIMDDGRMFVREEDYLEDEQKD